MQFNIILRKEGCIEYGYHWLGGHYSVADKMFADSARKCQALCNENDTCKWFAWRDAGDPNGCWLLGKKGSTQNIDYGRDLGATGPKFCEGNIWVGNPSTASIISILLRFIDRYYVYNVLNVAVSNDKFPGGETTSRSWTDGKHCYST